MNQLTCSFVGASIIATVCATADGQMQVAPVHFVENTANVGINPDFDSPIVMGIGAAAADVDDDGDIDLWVANWDGSPCRYYRNEDGVFVDQTSATGITVGGNFRTGIWFDCDADNDLDLVMVSDDETLTDTVKLYRQTAGGNFLDFTGAAGLNINTGLGHRGGIAAGDINGDGYLDLYLGMWNNDCHLLLNDGDASFTDITAASGLNTGFNTQHQPMMADFNEDGLLDIYVAVDFDENHLWLNQGDLTFVDNAVAAGAAPLNNDMGMTLGDYDSDGDLDIFTTNIYRFLSGVQNQNVLLRNDTAGGIPAFTDVAVEQGVENTRWGWGTTFFDADNDGHLDLVATNGWLTGVDEEEDWPNDRTHFFHNNGSGPNWFTPNIAGSVGLNDSFWGSSMIAADFDRDGDLDLFQTTMNDKLRYLENRNVGIPRNHLVIKPRMDGPNCRAIGGTVHIVNDGHTQMRLISAGTSYLGQEPAEAFFGLNTSSQAETVTVNYPDGTSTTIHNIPANAALTVTPGPLTFLHNERGTIAVGDLETLSAADNDRFRLDAKSGRAVLRVGGKASNLAATTLDVNLEFGAGVTGIDCDIELFNWTTQSWDLLASVGLFNRDNAESFIGLAAADYINAASGAMDLRLTSYPGESQARSHYDLVVDFIEFVEN